MRSFGLATLALCAVALVSACSGRDPAGPAADLSQELTGGNGPFLGSAVTVNLAAAGILYRISALNGEDEALTRSRWAREAA